VALIVMAFYFIQANVSKLFFWKQNKVSIEENFGSVGLSLKNGG